MAGGTTIVPPATVVSVVTNGGTQVVWTFSTAVIAIADSTGLIVDGDNSTAYVSGFGTSAITMDYPNPHSPGGSWDLDSVTAGITFSPATTIADDNGATT